MRLKSYWSLCLITTVTSQNTYENIDPTFVKGGYSEDGYKVTNSVEESSNNQEGERLVEAEIPQYENCHEYTEKYGYECVSYFQCDNGTIVTDGSGIIDIRNGFGPESSACPNDLDVCCKDPDFVPPPPEKLKYAPRCGNRNENGLGPRISGFKENESHFGEWPHMCAVLYEQLVEEHKPAGEEREPELVNLFQCGGSLIAPGVILTAAHCVYRFQYEPTRLKVRCGEWDTQNQNEPLPHQDRKVISFRVHPEFNENNLHNDFAVLFTSEDFQLSQHIDTVCLPDPDEEFDSSQCFASGWGKDKFGAQGEYQVILKEIDLPIVPKDDCQYSLRQTKLGNKFKLDDSFICAGGVEGKDTCHGDGGSPLVCPSQKGGDTYTQAGIVSWGVGCGEDGSPGVYASVSRAVCWIDHAVSCFNGGGDSSILGLDQEKCNYWFEDKINALKKQKENLQEKIHSGIDMIIQQFETCNFNVTDILIGEVKESTTAGYGNPETSRNDTYTEREEIKENSSKGTSDNSDTETYNESQNIKGNGTSETVSDENYGSLDSSNSQNTSENNQEEQNENETNGSEFAEELNNKEEASSSYGPDDYVEPDSGDLINQATTEVDTTSDDCADYSNQGYECVPYYNCQNGKIISDGAGLIDIRNGFGVLSPKDSKCPGFLDVCCKNDSHVPTPLPPQFNYKSKCGQRHENGIGARIQGFDDGESQFGEWPHMCAVLHDDSKEGQQPSNLYLCGGSLIAPGVVLTAGHCVNKFRGKSSELKVRCGEWDTQNETEPYPFQERKIKDFKIHPLFNPINLHNDFAVLFIEKDFVPQKHIDTICLPRVDEVFNDQTCFATGWGKDQFGSAGEYQVVLKEIDLPVVNETYCESQLGKTRLGKKFKLDDSFLCAGGVDNKDTCKGDGGSPLVCPSKYQANTYVQAGIVAWGIGCGENNVPGVYAAVSKGLCWIDYVMSCQQDGYTDQFPSLNGYTHNECQPYMDDLRAAVGGLPQKIRDGLGLDTDLQCNVVWPQGSAKSTNADSTYSADQTDDGDNYSDQTTNNSADQTDDGNNYVDQTANNSADQIEEQTTGNSYTEDLIGDADQTLDSIHSEENKYSSDKIGGDTSYNNQDDSLPAKIVDKTNTEDIEEENIPEPVYK